MRLRTRSDAVAFLQPSYHSIAWKLFTNLKYAGNKNQVLYNILQINYTTFTQKKKIEIFKINLLRAVCLCTLQVDKSELLKHT